MLAPSLVSWTIENIAVIPTGTGGSMLNEFKTKGHNVLNSAYWRINGTTNRYPSNGCSFYSNKGWLPLYREESEKTIVHESCKLYVTDTDTIYRVKNINESTTVDMITISEPYIKITDPKLKTIKIVFDKGLPTEKEIIVPITTNGASIDPDSKNKKISTTTKTMIILSVLMIIGAIAAYAWWVIKAKKVKQHQDKSQLLMTQTDSDVWSNIHEEKSNNDK